MCSTSPSSSSSSSTVTVCPLCSLCSVEVCGVFQAVDAKHENLVISNLDSGIGMVPTALVRWSDILSITTTAEEADAGGGG